MANSLGRIRSQLTNLLASLIGIGAYARSNIVGTVTDTSGVPSGAILESGTNANGQYTKYADGTLICTQRVNVNSTGTYATGSLFTSDAYTGSWPAVFVALPVVTASLNAGAGSTARWPSCYQPWTVSSTGAWAGLASTNAGVSGTVNLIAVGRWKA